MGSRPASPSQIRRRSRAGGRGDDRIDVEVGGRTRSRQLDRRVGPADVTGGGIVGGVDRDRLDPEHGRRRQAAPGLPGLRMRWAAELDDDGRGGAAGAARERAAAHQTFYPLSTRRRIHDQSHADHLAAVRRPDPGARSGHLGPRREPGSPQLGDCRAAPWSGHRHEPDRHRRDVCERGCGETRRRGYRRPPRAGLPGHQGAGRTTRPARARPGPARPACGGWTPTRSTCTCCTGAGRSRSPRPSRPSATCETPPLTRNWGVSNFDVSDLDDLMSVPGQPARRHRAGPLQPELPGAGVRPVPGLPASSASRSWRTRRSSRGGFSATRCYVTSRPGSTPLRPGRAGLGAAPGQHLRDSASQAGRSTSTRIARPWRSTWIARPLAALDAEFPPPLHARPLEVL